MANRKRTDLKNDQPEHACATDAASEYCEKKDWFDANCKDRATDFFMQFPNCISWDGSCAETIQVLYKAKNGFCSSRGYLIFDDEGEITEWRAYRGGTSFKREHLSLSMEMLVSQIKGLLTDEDLASRYCEQVSMSLLEEGVCIFNAPYGLKLKEAEFEQRYHSKEWENAWIESLKEEFQAKDVCRDEKAGIGCFRLQAI